MTNDKMLMIESGGVAVSAINSMEMLLGSIKTVGKERRRGEGYLLIHFLSLVNTYKTDEFCRYFYFLFSYFLAFFFSFFFLSCLGVTLLCDSFVTIFV